ncbi:hypothetical protein KIL84_002966 [Mauremys mutica]|uniref:Uncharacterized protein n=1 Tax=Mauremys mutica TaxID=74926 RepID=A0A9D3WUA3_9SAUR|nr:hypothetical protein KIL84_002966 [Mauremys mutica]
MIELLTEFQQPSAPNSALQGSPSASRSSPSTSACTLPALARMTRKPSCLSISRGFAPVLATNNRGLPELLAPWHLIRSHTHALIQPFKLSEKVVQGPSGHPPDQWAQGPAPTCPTASQRTGR